MQIVPTRPIPNQTLQVQLGNQPCTINVYQFEYGLFCDLYVGAALIIGGVICENANRIVRSTYLGFDGDIAFVDMEGSSDPDYTGLGTRFMLFYVTAADVASLGI